MSATATHDRSARAIQADETAAAWRARQAELRAKRLAREAEREREREAKN